MMAPIPGARNNGSHSSLPLSRDPALGIFFEADEMVQRLIEMTEESFNEGLLGAALVSLAVVSAILALISF